MESVGIVRKMDQVGRIVLPISLRHIFNINKNDRLEIFVDGTSIFLRKYKPSCIFCDKPTVRVYMGKRLCNDCLESLGQDTVDA